MRKIITILSITLLVLSAHAQIETKKTPPSFNENMLTPITQYELPEFDIKAMLEEDALVAKGEGPARFGKRHLVNVTPNDHGTWEELPNGDRIWRITFHSPKAHSLNFLFSQFYIPQGAELYAYNTDRSEVRGAFTTSNNKADGMFAITPINGSSVSLEYYEPAAVEGQGIIELSYVVHAYRDLHATVKEILEKGYGDSGACNNDVACPESAGWEDQINSVAIMISNGSGFCTGAIVNNTAQDGTPYFLSANHCGTNISGNWSFAFNYQSPSCNGPDGNFSQSIVGGTLRANNGESDFALFELSSLPPSSYSVYYSGWDNRNEAATSTVGIHHPAADVKKISFSNRAASNAGNFWSVDSWDDGTTEPGSSGSPLFNQDKLIIGQLCCGTASCANSGGSDEYGKIASSWEGGGTPATRLKDWLGEGVSFLEGTYLGETATCDDNIQNGSETGIDCGGSCPTPCICDGNPIVVTINLDNYPEETSWAIEDENGTTVASGGTYPNKADGSTLVINDCLTEQCYTFIIDDTYGDGVCCGYGNGSYSVTDVDGNVLASGAVFNDTESTNFCFTSSGCDDEGTTCEDGDPCTTGETYNADCDCVGGTFQDTDGDGTCDANDVCPNFNDDLIGIPCNDGDICTTGETYDTNCNCSGGIFQDADSDGICDVNDICPNDPTDNCNVDYCDAQGTNSYYEFIQSAELNGQTNNSGSNEGYGDYTGTIFATLVGTNTITLTPGFINNSYAENWSVWIDFNKDGDFDDTGEQVYTGTSTGTTPLIGTFNASLATGTTTMRIMMAWNVTPVPCGSFGFGEVEDYTVALGTICTPGTACDDKDDCTAGETYDADCNCTGGTLIDSDNDNVCDSDDACPGINDNIIGMACNDNNDCTAGETYDTTCNCTGGTFQDADNDGVCNADDICPGGDDNLDTDGDGIPDFCDTGGCTPGGSCDDGNPNTIEDTLDADCDCIGQAITPCVNGSSGGYPCDNVDLVGFMSNNQMGCSRANDIWGWTDPLTGKEYAIFGCTDRTTFIDISSPTNPVLIGSLSTNTTSSSWRDMKVYDDHAFIVSEADGHGMQAFDLKRLRNVNNPPVNFSADAVLTNLGGGVYLSNSHNIVINEESGYAYTVGSNTCSGGLTVININNPTSPTFEGCFSSDGYTHDAQCVNYTGPDSQYVGREICFNSNENTLTIVDVTNKSDMSQISRKGYAGQRYTHQGWLTEDHQYFLMNDELDESGNGHNTRTHIWNVRNLDNPSYLGYYEAAVGAIDHNLYIKGNLAYMANYRSGLRIVDVSNIGNANLQEVGYFDTYPSSNSASFNSAWSNYPYFESGYIIISDIEQGLFIVRYNNPNGGGGEAYGCNDSDNDGICNDDDPCPNDSTNTCNSAVPTYCAANANNSDYEYIQQVIFANINNTSSNNGGYGDFTSQVADVGLGDVVPMGLVPGFADTAYDETWRVWIDFNGDGDFNDAGEDVYSGTGSGTLSSDITIPNDASTGFTGMRVAMQWNNPAGSCGTFTHGEVEDYTVNIGTVSQNYNVNLLRNEDQLLASPSMRIQPNPASDFIEIGLQNTRDKSMIQLYDLTGRPIGQQILAKESDNLRIKVSHLPAGMYIIRLQSGSDTYATERFIKLSK